MSTQLLDTPTKHSWSLIGAADTLWNSARDSLISLGWGPIANLSEAAVVSLMQRMDKGHMRILTLDHVYTFPAPGTVETNAHDDLSAELRVINKSFWIRLALMSDLGFAEAYMYGDVECDDLVSLFMIFIHNRQNLAELTSAASWLFTLPQTLTSYRFLNSISNSQSNISAHYDISNDMFAGFLSEDMTYSCAIFKDLDGDLFRGEDRTKWSGGAGLTRIGPVKQQQIESEQDSEETASSTTDTEEDELYDAQIRKIRHILRKVDLRPGHRLLEIGSGWGALAIEAVRMTNCRVDTLTLSVAQKELAEQRIEAAGPKFKENITVHLMDYRNMPPEWEGAFDRFVSVEMIEAVGKDFLETYWEVVDWALKKKNAAGIVQVITIPEPRFERYIKEIDFIRKWVIFPGGFLPTVSILTESMRKGSSNQLIIDSISNIGPHYARTLREWRKRFLQRFEDVIVPALRKEYPDVMGQGEKGRREIEVFKRKWVYYYCYCEVGFTSRTLGDHIITFTREGNMAFGCDVYE